MNQEKRMVKTEKLWPHSSCILDGLEGTGVGGDVSNNLKKILHKGKKVNHEKKRQHIERKLRDPALKKNILL